MPSQAEKHLDQQLFHAAEKIRHAVVGENVVHLVGHPFVVVGAKAAVDHLGEHHLVHGMG